MPYVAVKAEEIAGKIICRVRETLPKLIPAQPQPEERARGGIPIMLLYELLPNGVSSSSFGLGKLATRQLMLLLV